MDNSIVNRQREELSLIRLVLDSTNCMNIAAAAERVGGIRWSLCYMIAYEEAHRLLNTLKNKYPNPSDYERQAIELWEIVSDDFLYLSKGKFAYCQR